jgi:uncharacterized protein YjbJ (UPF0337 family)
MSGRSYRVLDHVAGMNRRESVALRRQLYRERTSSADVFGKSDRCPSNGFDQEEDSATSGTSDKIKGRVKEAVGALTDDQRLKDEGRLDQTTGKIKKTVERVIDKANKTVKGS